MIREIKTIKEAAHEWVKEFSAIPMSIIEKAYCGENIDCISEITPPAIYNKVSVFENGNIKMGEIIGRSDDGRYIIQLDNGVEITKKQDDFEVERDSFLPMWWTMWMFGDTCDDYWLKDEENRQIMADCGFRIYEIEEGFIFGIDGAGYDFYDAHWIPLYKARGLQWHEYEK